MTISDFDGAQFWPAVKAFVANAGIEPISLGEPEDEVWRKIFAASIAVGSPLSLGMTPPELMRAAYALAVERRVDPDAWMSAFLPGSNIYTQTQFNQQATAGLAPKVLNIFAENAAGTEGWNLNVAKIQGNVGDYAWATAMGLKFDMVAFQASPFEPMSQFNAGTWDTQYVQILQALRSIAGPSASVIPLAFGHENDLPIQPDGHYAHTRNQPNGALDYKASWERGIPIAKALDPRFKFGFVRVGNITPYTPDWDWKTDMPDKSLIDYYGADPYFFPRFDGVDGARAAWVKLYAGIFALDQFRNYDYGKPFCFREYGACSADTAYNEVMFDWLYPYPKVMYVNWWDQNNTPAEGGVKPTRTLYDTSFASWPEQQAWWVREFNPPVLLTPTSVNVEGGVTTRVRLRCTKNRIVWTIIGNSRPDVITQDGTDLVVTLPSGSASVTVRASDKYKNFTDLTINVAVSGSNLYPVMDAGKTFMRGIDGQAARAPGNDFITGLAA